jgi:hypothetical protein
MSATIEDRLRAKYPDSTCGDEAADVITRLRADAASWKQAAEKFHDETVTQGVEIGRLRARVQQLEAALTQIDEINVESDHYQTAINRVIEAALPPASNTREGAE